VGPPFAAERPQELNRHRLIYHLPKPGPDGRTLTELRIAAFVTGAALQPLPPWPRRI